MPASPIVPALYLVATPIGNLGDITVRALETLAAVNVIACEDTRVTRNLLDRYGIATPLTPYHEHNAAVARPKLIARLAAGEAVALVSDAGTPLISDPGYKLVRETSAAEIAVTAIPGPSSVLAALNVAGLPTDRFFFEGFLPSKSQARRARLAELAAIPATLVLFESGTRIESSLHDLAAILGNRDAAVCRELTKLHEEIIRQPLTALADAVREHRGEFVIVIAPPDAQAAPMSDSEVDAMLRKALLTQSLKDAVAAVADAASLPRRDVYARALELSAGARDDT